MNISFVYYHNLKSVILYFCPILKFFLLTFILLYSTSNISNFKEEKLNNGSINAKDLGRIKRLRLIDDVFMSKCFEDNIECTELVVRIILDRNDVKVRKVHVQHSITNLQGKSTVLDTYAVDDKNKLYNIEI